MLICSEKKPFLLFVRGKVLRIVRVGWAPKGVLIHYEYGL